MEIGSKIEKYENTKIFQKPPDHNQIKVKFPIKKKPSLVEKDIDVATQESDSSGKNSALLEEFIVTYGKKTVKMHKTFENDGILLVDRSKNTAILKNSNDKIVGSESKFNRELFEGLRIEIDDKLIEIIEPKNEKKKYQLDQPSTSKISTYTPPNKKLKTEFPESATANRNLQKLTNDPKDQKPVTSKKNSFVLPEPSYEHQWKFNVERKPVCAVVVPDCLTEVLRPHQKEGVIFLYKCVMGFNSISNVEYFGCILADEMGIGECF